MLFTAAFAAVALPAVRSEAEFDQSVAGAVGTGERMGHSDGHQDFILAWATTRVTTWVYRLKLE